MYIIKSAKGIKVRRIFNKEIKYELLSTAPMSEK